MQNGYAHPKPRRQSRYVIRSPAMFLMAAWDADWQATGPRWTTRARGRDARRVTKVWPEQDIQPW